MADLTIRDRFAEWQHNTNIGNIVISRKAESAHKALKNARDTYNSLTEKASNFEDGVGEKLVKIFED